MPSKTTTSNGENSSIEAKISRSLRIFITAALVISLVIPLIESTFTLTASGQLVARSIDLMAFLTMLLAFIRVYLLNRRLSRRA